LRLPGAARRYEGLTLSLLLHAVLLIVLVAHGDRIWSRTLAPGDPALRGGESGSGGGGRRVAYITLPSIPKPVPPPQIEVTPPAPPPDLVQTTVPEPALTLPTPVPMADTAAVAEAGDAGGPANRLAGDGTDGGAGTGAAPGAGVGTGAGAGGEGGTFRPPEPRDMAFPFDPPPKELRGVSLSVTFWVRVDGRVERYVVEPEIKDREYAKKFDEVMRAFRFTPARAPDGRLVAGTTRISFTLPGKRSS
jgi:hypothetical protein